MKTQSFAEIEHYDFTQKLLQNIKSEISEKPKEYILNVNEDEFKNYLVETFKLEPIIIDTNTEIIKEPVRAEKFIDTHYGESYKVETYRFTVTYSFSGSPVLFRVKPSTFVMTTAKIDIDRLSNVVAIFFDINKLDAPAFDAAKKQMYQSAFANVKNINALVTQWNNELQKNINLFFDTTKSKYKNENAFYEAIKVKVNKDSGDIFNVPTVRRKIIIQPKVSQKNFTPEPTMDFENYNDIILHIYNSGKNMEKKPALYIGKDEEGLRDQFLFVLESRYDGITATGETFNRSGKTDIILKHAKDGSNLFVAECKVWHGPSEFLKAISQLFDLYLTWRDSKVALLIFVRNKDFTNVINQVKSVVKTHAYFIKESGNHGETSLSYIFHLPQDKAKEVYFEIMLFHYDKEDKV
jgi:hypothetical protein